MLAKVVHVCVDSNEWGDETDQAIVGARHFYTRRHHVLQKVQFKDARFAERVLNPCTAATPFPQIVHHLPFYAAGKDETHRASRIVTEPSRYQS